MNRGVALLAAGALTSLSASASSELLNGRYDAFVEAAETCAAATGPTGVDRAVVSSAGWPQVASGETDDMPVSAAYSRRNPFALRINASHPSEPEHCWFSVNFTSDGDYAQVRSRLEHRFGRAPDEVDDNDMRGARWLNPGNSAELWMAPASVYYPEPIMFFTVRPRTSD